MEKLVLTTEALRDIKTSLIESLTVASGAKSSATYYHNREEQIEAVRNHVNRLYNLSKELPLIVAAQKGVTGMFVSEVLLNEFKHTLRGGACNIVNPIMWYDNGLSEKAVLMALNNLGENGIPYVLRFFIELKRNKVNNERMRKIILGYIWGQDNLEFYAMKYRNKLARALKHVYGVRMTSILLSIAHKQVTLGNADLLVTGKEMSILNKYILKYYNGNSMKALKLLLFLFKEDQGINFDENEFQLLHEYQKAKTDITDAHVVPEEVLLGLISNPRHPQYHSMWGTKVQREATKALIRKNVTVTSVNQQVRQTKSTAKLGVEKTVDYNKATDFIALYKTGYENGFTDEIRSAIEKLAEKKKIDGFYYENIGIVLDTSPSMKGHKKESKNTPRAIAEFTAKVLGKSAKRSTLVKTDGELTDLASAFVNLLKEENKDNPYNAIFFLTDGYENAYEGLTNEVISAYHQISGNDIPMFQISPITGAETGAKVRKLGKNVVTMAVNNPTAIQPQIAARLLEIDTKRWLENQVHMLEEAPVKRSNKIIVNA